MTTDKNFHTPTQCRKTTGLDGRMLPRIALAIIAGSLLARSVLGAAVEVNYTGRVLDDRNHPIAGAKVALIGAPLSCSTDASGAFVLRGTVPADARSDSKLPPLEFTAAGHFAKTFLPDSVESGGIFVSLDSLATPEEGKPVDIGRFGYVYRRGATNNPFETRWLPSTELAKEVPAEEWDKVLCGVMWETPNRVDRVELVFPKGTGESFDAADLQVIGTEGHYSHDGNLSCWWKAEPSRKPLPPDRTPMDETENERRYIFQPFLRGAKGEPTGLCKVMALCKKTGVSTPVLRVLSRTAPWGSTNRVWDKPLVVEIEWGVDKAARAQVGRIEPWRGLIGAIEPLPGGAVTTLGAHHFRDNGTKAERRGIRVRMHAPKEAHAGAGQMIVSIVLDDYMVSFRPSDLSEGPIYIPRAGVFVSEAGKGRTAAQFREQLAREGRKTIRQRVNEAPYEQTWRGAMRVYWDVEKLPQFPEPPMEAPMRIDVPEKELVSQWRLGAWHLTRHCTEENARMMKIAIWPNKDEKGRPHAFTIAAESVWVIAALDHLGMHDIAERGLNYWLLMKDDERTINHSFTKDDGTPDNDGYLLRKEMYDWRHAGGHGEVMMVAPMHYRLTRNREWLNEVAPVLKRACDLNIRQYARWNSQLPGDSIYRGTLPPMIQSDFTMHNQMYLYCVALEYWYGTKRTAEILAEEEFPGGKELVSSAMRVQRELQESHTRAAARSAVAPAGDGSYRQFIPSSPLLRRFIGYAYDAVPANLLVTAYGLWDRSHPLNQDLMEVYDVKFMPSLNDTRNGIPPHRGPVLAKSDITDDWLRKGGYGMQPGWNAGIDFNLMRDEIPMYLRSVFNAYAVQIQPAQGYIFIEHPGAGDHDKVFEEARFLTRVRNMLVWEDGRTLWLARATPRAWLEQGKKVAVKNAPTYFGTVAYEIVSDVDNGKIDATVELPARKAPQSVVLRFRHPRSAPIKGVTVSGNAWTDFDKDKETITLKGLTGKVAVRAEY